MGFDSQQEEEIFSSPHHPDQLSDPPSLLSNVYCEKNGFSLKLTPPPFSAEVKNV
jgi:hypothetical protein